MTNLGPRNDVLFGPFTAPSLARQPRRTPKFPAVPITTHACHPLTVILSACQSAVSMLLAGLFFNYYSYGTEDEHERKYYAENWNYRVPFCQYLYREVVG